MAKKRFGFKNFFFSFVIVCIVIYIFQNNYGSVDTMIAENGTLEDIIKANGIIVKDEEVFSSNVDGSLTYYHEDGDKVNRGLLVADINVDSNSVQIKSQIKEIELAIEDKKRKDNINNSEDIQNVELNNNIFRSDLQASILNNDIKNVYNIIGQVNTNNSDNIDIQDSSNKYENYDIKELETMKNNLSNSMSANKIPYYSNNSGIITYKIDGLEDKYIYENVLNLTPSATAEIDYVETDSSKNISVAKGDKIFKIIRNFDYYIAATVNNEYAKLFEENKYIKTRILSHGVESEVWGYIKKINYGSEESVLIIYFDDFFYKVYDERYVDVQLITGVYDGLKIDLKSLVEKDGIIGVFVKDASNIVKFFPVEILGKDDENAVVYIGDYVSENKRRTITINENIHETIKIFDKIILEPDKVYEGQILK
ncbi:MAG: HlyD family efflux transporter periplasmic adaptor subunit [Tissierellia bacterium]|nr:HlyD family efflux transporter periplasmic adaptor subunit [Tissierellia bacterium]